MDLKIGFVESLRGVQTGQDAAKVVKKRQQCRRPSGDGAIVIPAGTQSETEIRMRGKGNYGEGGGDSGDLVAVLFSHIHTCLVLDQTCI